MNVSKIQKQKIIDFINEGKRFDGRNLDEFRDIDVKLDISSNAEGSCSVKVGETEVYCGVKLAVTEPYPDSQDEGTFMTTVELSPMASEDFELGPPRIDAIELGRIIDRGIRESGFIDFKKLCIKEGEKVWQVFVDIMPLNDDGNLMDVCGLAALIALANAKLPVYDLENDELKHELSEEPLPLNKEAMSFNMTFHKVGNEIIVDPNAEEEDISDFRLSIAVADNKGEPRITAMQKGKGISITEEEMDKILDLVEKEYKEMFPKISKIVWGK